MMPGIGALRRDFIAVPSTAPVLRAGDGAPSPSLGDAVIAIGAFDGVHVGHRSLLAQTVADARSRGAAAVAVTFDPDPDRVVGPAPAPKLMGVADRLRALAASGVDAVLVIPFTREVAGMDHAGFFDRVLAPRLRPLAVHVGSDFRLGRGGASTVEVMRAWGADRGLEVVGHELVCDDGSAVSATRIRRLLREHRVEAAASELGRHPMLRGRIGSGRGQGTSMGFPTANIVVDEGLAVPGDGVYEGLALIDGTVWPAAVNVGLPPTFAGDPDSAHLEANLIGFTGDVRGSEVALAFTRFLRPSRAFSSTDELIETVLGNIDDIRSELGDEGVRIA